MLNNRKICRIVTYGTYYTYCNEPSNTNPYGLQHNYAKLKLEYVSSGTYLKFQQDTWFLLTRTQTVMVNGKQSSISELLCGVPQGSVLGPILFLLHTADIMEIANRHDLSAHSYADDTQLKFHAKPKDCLQRLLSLEACVKVMSDWMSSNRLKINTDKTQFIWLGTNQ